MHCGAFAIITFVLKKKNMLGMEDEHHVWLYINTSCSPKCGT